MPETSASTKFTIAPCSNCMHETRHEILFQTTQTRSEDDERDTFAMLKCAGCETISMSKDTLSFQSRAKQVSYYPSPVSRKLPRWCVAAIVGLSTDVSQSKVVDLLYEIFQATDGGQKRLAAMGIRALIEQVMIAKVGDHGNFQSNLNAFQANGYISVIQRDALRETLELGHATMHRAFEPNDEELSKALDIVEGILAAIYDHAPSSANLSKRLPPRAPRNK